MSRTVLVSMVRSRDAVLNCRAGGCPKPYGLADGAHLEFQVHRHVAALLDEDVLLDGLLESLNSADRV